MGGMENLRKSGIDYACDLRKLERLAIMIVNLFLFRLRPKY